MTNNTKTASKSLANTRNYRRTIKGILTNTYQHQKLRHEVEYSLKELHDRYITDKKMIRLHKEWVNSGYNKQMKPSLDRIDCFKHYSLENLNLMTWAENRYKQRMEFKRIRARKVYQILNNKVVNTYKSVSDVVRKTGVHQGNLSSCLNGNRNYVSGYKWSYENPELLEEK